MEFAKALNLDASYVSQLENAKRRIDDWYVDRAKAMLEAGDSNFDFSKSDVDELSIREACVQHLIQFLDTCRGDLTKLGWALVELRNSFPLSKWGNLDDVSGRGKESGIHAPVSSDENIDPDKITRIASAIVKREIDRVKRSGVRTPTAQKRPQAQTARPETDQKEQPPAPDQKSPKE